MIQTRRSLALLLAGAVSLFLAACASVMGPKVITFSEADLAHALESHGPYQKRLLEVLDVRVNKPSVHVMPEVNRLSSDLELVTTERVSGKTYAGSISVDYALRYDEPSQSIRLTQVHVNRLQINNLPSPEKTGLNRLGALVAEQLLNDVAIYRFKPGDLKNAEGYGYKPGAVTVTSRGVEVTLSPIR
ncbi:DUF1439 domain-containing protein [Piscinibacter terrae]|uniref:DUF1439 domain-containing protein n=1 Tax=Piscinibacter terrae TaxID=2496871 RepID=A0A3N7HW66_9BURK|nr:DUF1439 domain-containing protein [Albitalea terrae]RQP25636.1 DUF1439 domain-containing protein [Albitalea terrae]